VVSDFRRADCAAGGQGAPLVPFADYILFRHPTKNRVLLNIGGIANITWIPAGASIDQITAFDTGPGNCISDWLMRTRVVTETIDFDGQRASRGIWLHAVVNKMLLDDYFYRPSPKSTDVPEMVQAFIQAANDELQSASLDDLLATACSCTACAVDHAISFTLGLEESEPYELIVSGGGIHNVNIMSALRSLTADGHPRAEISSSQDHGVSIDSKEAVAFALLGAATLDGVPSNVPSVTGARRRVILGSITPVS
jgi:anhydro-N-acetylmuramic acid kinase